MGSKIFFPFFHSEIIVGKYGQRQKNSSGSGFLNFVMLLNSKQSHFNINKQRLVVLCHQCYHNCVLFNMKNRVNLADYKTNKPRHMSKSTLICNYLVLTLEENFNNLWISDQL